MDPVREALLLVADDATPTRLLPPAHLRQRAEQGRRRRRVVGSLVGVAAAAALVWVAAAGPWVHARTDSAPIANPSATPTATPSLLEDGCGFSLACPQGRGPFRVVMGAARGGDELAVDVALPQRWGVRDYTALVLRLTPTSHEPEIAMQDPAGVAVLWRVARHGTASATDAESLAKVVAATAGSTSAMPQPVSLGGHPGWRVRLDPAASTPGAVCEDPTVAWQGGRWSSACRVLLDLELRHAADLHTAIGVGDAATVEVTLVDAADVLGAGASGVAAVLQWGDPSTAAWRDGAALVDGLRWATYADPFCGRYGGPQCGSRSGEFDLHGDPIMTLSGIHDWRAHATVNLAPGWSVLSDDARGHVSLVNRDDVTSAMNVVWQPAPASGTWSATDAHAWATAMLHRPHLTATAVQATTLGGRPAWTVDVAVRQNGPEAGVPCPGSTTGYAVTLECSGPGPNPPGTALFSNEQARLWFVQADEGHVLMVSVVGTKIHIGQPPILASAVAATASMIDSLRISTAP